MIRTALDKAAAMLWFLNARRTQNISGRVTGISLDHVQLFASDQEARDAFIEKCFDAEFVWDEPPAGARGEAMHHLGVETDEFDSWLCE